MGLIEIGPSSFYDASRWQDNFKRNLVYVGRSLPDVNQIDLRLGLTLSTQIGLVTRRFFSSASAFSRGKDGKIRRR